MTPPATIDGVDGGMRLAAVRIVVAYRELFGAVYLDGTSQVTKLDVILFVAVMFVERGKPRDIFVERGRGGEEDVCAEDR